MRGVLQCQGFGRSALRAGLSWAGLGLGPRAWYAPAQETSALDSWAWASADPRRRSRTARWGRASLASAALTRRNCGARSGSLHQHRIPAHATAATFDGARPASAPPASSDDETCQQRRTGVRGWPEVWRGAGRARGARGCEAPRVYVLRGLGALRGRYGRPGAKKNQRSSPAVCEVGGLDLG